MVTFPHVMEDGRPASPERGVSVETWKKTDVTELHSCSYNKAPHAIYLLSYIPDVVTTPLGLYVMEGGCPAAPERGVSGETMKAKIIKLQRRVVTMS